MSNEPLYMQMKRYLLELISINKGTANYKLPSENMLAIRFGASRIAAKHAFQILEEEGLIYRQRGRGTFIAEHAAERVMPRQELPTFYGNDEDAIALILPFTGTIFMSEIVEGIQQELHKYGLHFVIFLTDNDQRREVAYLRIAQERFRGALIFPGAYNTYHEEFLRLVLNRFPLVQIDRHLPGLNLSYVACDHLGATCRAVQLLLEKGHERVGFIGHHANHASSVTDRIRGFDKATQAFNPAYSQSFKLNIVDTLENFDEIFTAYMQAMQPTALISSSHLHGPAIMRLLREMHLENEVELMLYDNEFALMHDFLGYRPYVIDQNPRVIGQTAARLVYDLAYKGAPPQTIELKESIYRG